MKNIFCFFWALILPLSIHAQIVTVKGVGTASYASDSKSAAKEKAYVAAQVSAVERYFAESGEAESQNFENIQKQVEDNLDKFILSTIVLNEEDQKNLNRYSIAVKAELNIAKLRNTLRRSSSINQVSDAQKSQLVYVFVGREADSVRSYDDRIVKRADVKAQESQSKRGQEGESIRSGSISTHATKTTTREGSYKVETGGSRTRRADSTTYRLLPLTNAKTSITSVFSQGGFNVADPEFVLADSEMASVNKDFSSGNDLAPSTMRSVVSTMRKSNIPLLVLATLDVGVPSQDDATGMQRVAITVTSRVLDLKNTLPREIASIPAVQYFGIGPDNASAINKGLKDASVAAAREITSRLNASGIQ